ncbi:mechanosensitive ion channel family protein [uncultured Limnobacter sp.]|uniref:mechanosensitive ion channel family protein n=1 Tax=Limnobacter sp. TaxID=2003368 RepID=UPI0030F5816F
MNEQLETLFKYIEPAKLLDLGLQATKFILVIIVALIVLRLVKAAIDRVGKRMQNRSSTLDDQKRVETLTRVLKYVSNVVILLLGSLIALGTIGISIAPVLAAAGVVGLAVGFGAQSLVKDYFTGVVLLIENQIRAGDFIEVGGKSGTVENVTLRYVRMRDAHGNVHFVPNGQIDSVTNSTMDFAYAVVDIGIAYKEDVEGAIQVMQKVGTELAEDKEWGVKITEPMATFGVQELADSAVIVRVRFKTTPGDQWGVRREYNKRIKAAFDNVGIEIPFPHVTMYPGAGVEIGGSTTPQISSN